jgi:isoquinoline 1-oxidoreductase alpha subunit
MPTLTLNGERRSVDVPPETPLLWVIREELGLTGTKFGCGKGLCGACTVLIDGVASRSCITPVAGCETLKIDTIESLGTAGDHPVQRAWQSVNVPQCGYCQSGQIMAAVALLKANPSPTDADIDAAMAGNICRCGTYTRIRAAIHAAAAVMRGR